MSDNGRADKGEARTSPKSALQYIPDATEATASTSTPAVRAHSLRRSHSRMSRRRPRRRDIGRAATASSAQRTPAGSSMPRDETQRKRASKAPSVADAPPKRLSGEQSIPAKERTALVRSPAEPTTGCVQLDSPAPTNRTCSSDTASLSPYPVKILYQANEAPGAASPSSPPEEQAAAAATQSAQQDCQEASSPLGKNVMPKTSVIGTSPQSVETEPSADNQSPLVHSFWSMFSSNEYQMSYIGKRSEYLVCMACGMFAAGLILASFLLAKHLKAQPDYVLVQGPFGVVRGIAITAEGGRRVQAFYGVPFAKEPVGELRFAKPQPSEPGVSDVSQMRETACPQLRLGTHLITDEDCLRLNIWMPMGCITPETILCGNKTVLVFLTGDLFQVGDADDASADGSLLAALGDVAVVTIAYRLGALGFLCASDDPDAGNMGLYDQLEAMAWVRKYIAYFGGNESEITVAGHGSGAASLGYHMLNPYSGWAHFIDRFIVMSNSPYNRQIDSREEATNKTASLSKKLSCGDPADDRHLALNCLRNVDVTLLLKASSPAGDHPTSLFFPMHDSELLPARPSPRSHLISIKEKKVLIGYAASAGAYQAALLERTQSRYVLETSVEEYALDKLRWLGVPDAEQVVAVYEDPTSAMDQAWLRRVFGGVLNACPVRYFAEHLAHQGSNAVYFYVMDSTLSYEQHDLSGSELTHTEDLQFLFGLPFRNRSASEEDAAYSRSLIAIWTKFAKTGRLPTVQGQHWPAFDPRDTTTVALSRTEPLVLTDMWKSECDALRNYLM